MAYRKNIVTLSSASTVLYAALVAGCGESGSGADTASNGVGHTATTTTGTAAVTVTSGTVTSGTVTSGTVTSGTVTSGTDGTVATGTTTTTGGAATTTGTTGTTTTAGTTGTTGTTTTAGTTGSGGTTATTTDGTTTTSTVTNTSTATTGSTTGGPTFTEGPCDIYEAGGTPCAGAYSMVRRLSTTYTGPLYQVRRGGPSPNTGSGGETMDIAANAEGFADAASQDVFCGNQTCTVSILYDQSVRGNDLTVAPGGCYDGGDGAALEDDYESSATREAITVGGHNVYGLYMNPHEGYRNNDAVGTAEGSEGQGVYLLADGTHSGSACCWDFGTANRDTCWGPTGIMGALMLGWAYWGTGAGSGPWMMADFELGVWSGGSFPSFGLDGAPAPDPALTYNPNNPSLNTKYAFGILTTGADSYALRMGNAASGPLTTAWDGDGPVTMILDGGIILGVGGDNSNWSFGTFYEGAITIGRPSAATDEAIFQNVQAAGWGQ